MIPCSKILCAVGSNQIQFYIYFVNWARMDIEFYRLVELKIRRGIFLFLSFLSTLGIYCILHANCVVPSLRHI